MNLTDVSMYDELFRIASAEVFYEDDVEELFNKKEKFDAEKHEQKREKFIDNMYRMSIENEYIDSMFNLVTSKENFDRMVKPNSAKDLKDLARKIQKDKGIGSFDYSKVDNLFNRVFMNRVRHAFILAKNGIGIAA